MPGKTSGKTTGPHVVCLLSDEVMAFEYGVSYEVFGLPRPEFGHDWYRFGVCAVHPGGIRLSGGLLVSIDHGLEALLTADIVLVPGWPDVTGPIPKEVVAALRKAHENGARLVSLCSGVIVLAETGVLNNRKAATHWRFIDTVSQRFPEIQFDPDVLYVDEGNVLSAAGSAAGIDLCLHIVRADYGVAAANAVARGLVMPPHREGGQSQYIQQPVSSAYDGPRIGAVIDRMRGNLSNKLNIKDLAGQAGMSPRTFQRRFEAATGLAPSTWLLKERLRVACERLESDIGATLDDIAEACGFGTLPTMRHHFRQKLGVSPGQYRKTFAPPPMIQGDIPNKRLKRLDLPACMTNGGVPSAPARRFARRDTVSPGAKPVG